MNNNVPHVPVKSSNIKSVAYDQATGSMDVRFHSGGVYRYHGVPPATHTKLMTAKSKGGFLDRGIVGKFKTTQLS